MDLTADFENERHNIQAALKDLNPQNFEALALKIFRFQAQYNPLYAKYLHLLGVNKDTVNSLSAVPYLPIQFFKNQSVQTGNWTPEMTFTSSGTTGNTTARHPVRTPESYLLNCERLWAENYGKIENYCVLALLPAYLEREGSSLIYMAQHFINKSLYKESGFFLYNIDVLLERIKICREKKIPTVLLGVSFALWDLAETHAPDLSNIIVMETGGMKGRRKEITRNALHNIFCKAFKVDCIHSEYGMTELFSQAYSKGKGIFHPSSTLRITTREITDPLSQQKIGKTGAVNLTDLANYDTISFIASDDLARVYADGSFEILGRLDASDIRGCNLLVSEV